LYSNTTGNYNSAFGTSVLYSNTTGGYNDAHGRQALYNNTTGSSNVAMGYQAMYSNTTAQNCTAVGYGALWANTTGADNTAVGTLALDACTTGTTNAAFGYNSLTAMTTGIENAGFGKGSLQGCTTGNYNTAVGKDAGNNISSGRFQVCLGAYAKPAAATTDNEIAIGYAVIGKGAGTGFINPGGTGAVYQGNNSSSWSTTSDRRIKKNIVNNTTGLDKINQITVHNFEYKTEDEIKTDNPELADVVESAVVNKEGVQLGVIAQEIETILPDVVKTQSTGVKSVDPDNLTWYLVNAIKELSAKVAALEAG